MNLFHGRLEAGNVAIKGSAKSVSDTSTNGTSTTRPHGDNVAYVRPHDIDVHRTANGDSIAATIEQINFAGPVVYLYLKLPDGGHVESAVPRDRYRELNLQQNEPVHLTFRNARVFGAEDYSI